MPSDNLRQSISNFGVDIDKLSIAQVECLISLLELHVKKWCREADVEQILRQIRTRSI